MNLVQTLWDLRRRSCLSNTATDKGGPRRSSSVSLHEPYVIQESQKGARVIQGTFYQRIEQPHLRLQFDLCLMLGKTFRDATLVLEGDGFLSPFVMRYLRDMRQSLQQLQQQRLQHPMFIALGQKGVAYGLADQQLQNALMKEQIVLFNAAFLFHPKEINSVAMEKLVGHIATLSQLKNHGVADPQTSLLGELPIYQREAQEQVDYLRSHPLEDTPHALWDWWLSIRERVPMWFAFAKIVVLIQPSSAVVERQFSKIKGSTSPTQNAEYAETHEARILALCNGE